MLNTDIPQTQQDALKSMDPQALKNLLIAILNGEQENYNLLNLLENSIQTLTPLDSETALNFALLFNDIEHKAELNDKLEALTFDEGPPALAVSTKGQIVGHNSTALPHIEALAAKNLFSLGVSQSEFLSFKERTIRHLGPSILHIHLDIEADTPQIFTGQYQSEHHVFMLREVSVQWSASMDCALGDLFNLTKAEREVLIGLSKGLQAEQISTERQSKITTVRQQIKSILQKLEVNSQVQAVAIAATLGSQKNDNAAITHQRSSISASPTNPLFALSEHEFVRDHRRVGWRRFGKKGGIPILLMHSTFFGAGSFAPERALANKHGLDVIIVERPGFGKTQPPLPSCTEGIFETHLKDCIHLLDQLGVDKVWLKGDDYGFAFAVVFAHYYSNRVHGIFAVSPPPQFKNDSDLSSIPVQQRVFIWAARHCFWVIKLLIKAGQVKARKLGPNRWMEMVFDGTPHELSVFESPEGKEVSKHSYHFNLIQNSKGHVLDLQALMAQEWVELLQHIDLPLTGLAGVKNTTFDINAVTDLSVINPNFTIEKVETASLTLPLTDVQLCYQRLIELINSNTNA